MGRSLALLAVPHGAEIKTSAMRFLTSTVATKNASHALRLGQAP